MISASDAAMAVAVGISPIALEPASLFRGLGAADETLRVSIPIGSNANADVDLTLTTSDTSVADLLGASAGSLALHFLAGGPTFQDVTVQFGGVGSASLTASDDGSELQSGVASVVTSVDLPVELEVNIAPYLQLGDAALGEPSDQFVLAWQTILRARGGPNADRFSFEYRRVGDVPWTPASLQAPVPHGSTSRLNQWVLVSGLQFAEQYEYRLRHLRNEIEIASYQAIVNTRRTDGVRFTAFGNSGQGVVEQYEVGGVMSGLMPDFNLLLGDIIYEAGEYELYKPRIGDPYAAFLASHIMHASLGNHDRTWDLGQAAQAFFFEPLNGRLSGPTELDYSFDYGPVHFVGVDTGSTLGHDILENETRPWLAADLAASTKPWKIVFSHETPITRDPNPDERKEDAKVRNFVLTAAIENGADLYLGGSVHSIQRYLPITKVIPEENYVEWAACPQARGVTPVYAGSGSWFRSFAVTEPLIPPLEFYEPGLGLMLIDVDATDLTISLFDENGALLETPVTISQCLAPGDCSCPCGDAVLEVPEECDDGNAASGDGCSSTCLIEDGLGLFGSVVGGLPINLAVSGIDVSATTKPGDLIHDVIVALANAINGDTALQGVGVTAFSSGDALITNGSFDSVSSSDPGVMVPEPGTLVLRAAALGVLALLARRLRREAAR